MDFRFTDREEAFRQEVRAFAKQVLPDEWPLANAGLAEFHPEVWPHTRRIARQLGERKWLALGWPEEYGGRNESLWQETVYLEEMAYWLVPGTTGGVGGIGWVGPTLLRLGTEEQKARFLPKLATGQEFWCTGYSEPGAGSDLASLQTRAVANNGAFVVDGQKVWTSAAHIADWCWLAVRTNPEGPKHRGVSVLIVDMKSPGIKVRPINNLTGDHSFNEVYFDGVKVPRENLVGEENKGWLTIMTALQAERAAPSIRSVSFVRRTLDELCGYLSGRPLAAQAANELAELAVEVQVARLLAYRCVGLLVRGGNPDSESNEAKLFVSELTQRVASFGMRTLGLYGQLRPGSPFAQLGGSLCELYLSSLGNTILGGTSEIVRTVIAQRGLGLPR